MDTEEFLRRYSDCVNVMDNEIREGLHFEMAPCTEIEFLKAYTKRDPSMLAYINSEHKGLVGLLIGESIMGNCKDCTFWRQQNGDTYCSYIDYFDEQGEYRDQACAMVYNVLDLDDSGLSIYFHCSPMFGCVNFKG
jgi:hypothetical protein